MENWTTETDDSEYIIIPNPIYDVVFRYLMEDPESATIVISTLINQKIKRLQLEPLTHSEKKQPVTAQEKTSKQEDIKLFHLDFTATIELADGSEELIMIELQKAAEPEDIFRFKRYVSKNFQKKIPKEVINPTTQAVETIDTPIRVIPVFILNFRIENEINDLFIQITRTKKGLFKNKTLEKHNEFIDHLSYDMCVVQLPNIANIKPEDYEGDENKEKLFALLKIFDQTSQFTENKHRLRLIRKFFPGFLTRVIRRLQAAAVGNPELEEQMFFEDEYLKARKRQQNTINFLEKALAEEREQGKEKEKVLLEKEKALAEERRQNEEKEKALAEERRQNEEKEKALLQKEKVLAEERRQNEEKEKALLQTAKKMKLLGISTDEIAELTKLSADVINGL